MNSKVTAQSSSLSILYYKLVIARAAMHIQWVIYSDHMLLWSCQRLLTVMFLDSAPITHNGQHIPSSICCFKLTPYLLSMFSAKNFKGLT